MGNPGIADPGAAAVASAEDEEAWLEPEGNGKNT